MVCSLTLKECTNKNEGMDIWISIYLLDGLSEGRFHCSCWSCRRHFIDGHMNTNKVRWNVDFFSKRGAYTYKSMKIRTISKYIEINEDKNHHQSGCYLFHYIWKTGEDAKQVLQKKGWRVPFPTSSTYVLGTRKLTFTPTIHKSSSCVWYI